MRTGNLRAQERERKREKLLARGPFKLIDRHHKDSANVRFDFTQSSVRSDAAIQSVLEIPNNSSPRFLRFLSRRRRRFVVVINLKMSVL